jgi:hypothetical protein
LRRAPIVTTRSKHLHSLMPFQSYRDNEDVRAIVLVALWAIEVMTRKRSGKAYEFAGLGLGSPSETPDTVVDWADGVG